VLISLLLFFGARLPALTSFNLRRTLMQRAVYPAILLLALIKERRMQWLALTFVLLFAAPVAAQEAGEPQAGAAYAKQYCANCHAIADEHTSPEHTAPRFKDVANTSGMTATALTIWLQTSHPTMPNIILEPNDMSNVVAYILSLKD
jgi:mono/diheme cytochrome c family protein